MDNDLLIKKMNLFISVRENGLKQITTNVESMSFANLRDCLIGLGTILDEDFDIETYVINVSAGMANKNCAVVVAQLKENELLLLSYAKEGIISQHTAEKAIDKVLKRVAKYVRK